PRCGRASAKPGDGTSSSSGTGPSSRVATAMSTRLPSSTAAGAAALLNGSIPGVSGLEGLIARGSALSRAALLGAHFRARARAFHVGEDLRGEGPHILHRLRSQDPAPAWS